MDWLLILTSIALLAGTFKLLDFFVSDSEEKVLKNKLFDWWCHLSELRTVDAASNAKVKIQRAFETIYGEDHFSRRCFIASSLSSILAMILCLIAFTLYWGSGPDFKSVDILDGIIFWMAINLLVDYFSLIETRWIISLDKKIGIVILSLTDIILSLFIYFFCVVVLGPSLMPAIFAGYGFEFNFIETLNSEINIFLQRPQEGVEYEQGLEGKSFYGIFGWSTLFTSFLFQTYVLTTLVFKLLGLTKGRLIVFLERMESSKRTFTAFGGFLSIVVGLGMVSIKLFSNHG